MSTQSQMIDDVVQSVLRELRGKGTCTTTAEAPGSSPRGVVIDDPVVTEATLAGRVSGLREVVFSPRTVLTPTAKDYLRSNQISWTRSGVVGYDGTGSSTGPKIVATHSTIAVGSAFNGGDLVRIGLKDASRVVSEAVSTGVVLVLTAKPHSLAINLNRNEDLRAIALEDITKAAPCVLDAKANCVCVKPNGRSKDELKNLARTISNCGGKR